MPAKKKYITVHSLKGSKATEKWMKDCREIESIPTNYYDIDALLENEGFQHSLRVSVLHTKNNIIINSRHAAISRDSQRMALMYMLEKIGVVQGLQEGRIHLVIGP